MKRVWLVRLGKFGETEAHALATGELITGWTVSNLEGAQTRAEILALVAASYPNEKMGTLQNWAIQLNQLKNYITAGDMAVVPLKTTGQIAIGTVLDQYFDAPGDHPARHVEWLVTDLPRDAVKQDLLYSLGATQTVCSVSRNDAVKRFEVLAQTRRDPGPRNGLPVRNVPDANGASIPTPPEDEPPSDLADVARDQIERFIAANFIGHAFTELVADVLRAQGYLTRVSPPGADRGIDIVAGQGPLGFGKPSLVVQVKSGGIVVDQPTLQSLLGSLTDAHADQGLLVSWSGFNSSVRQRLNELYFRIRIWNRADFIAALLNVYDQLSEETRAALPLRRLWTLVPNEELDV